MPGRAALIAGATGLTGQHLLARLLNDPRYSAVHALLRKPQAVTHPKVIARVVDFVRLPSLPKIDDVFCCLGTTIKKAGSKDAFRRVDFEYVVNLAHAAKRAGAKRFLVISALGATTASQVFYNRVKGEMEETLRTVGFDELAIFQPSFLVGERAESRPGEQIGIKIFQAIAPLLIGPARKYRAIRADDVAKAMIAVASQNRAGASTYLSDEIQRIADKVTD
jgi:uncharacterized protein YbjT (DUF2867 family)